jgi:AcrR family transcriptional regulator
MEQEPEATPRPATTRSTPRRVEIAAQAALVFADSSYHTVGMREVAAAVGIRGASLYNHFSSKEEILYEIALSVTRDTVEGWISILDAPGRPAERLAALIRSHLQHVAARRVEHLVAIKEVRALTEEHRRHVLDYRTYYHRRVRDVIVAGHRTGDFSSANPRVATTALMDMLNGVSAWYRPEMDVGELADDYIRLGIGGLLGHDGDLDALCRRAVERIRTSGLTLLEPTAVTPPGSPTSAARA